MSRLARHGSPPTLRPLSVRIRRSGFLAARAQPSSIRNSFGLRFDPVTGSMWETENEPATDDTDSLRLVGTPTGSPVPTGSPTTPGFDGGARTGVGLVIAAVLIGGLILLRRRILRR
jgi:hypothetical protein